MGKFKFSSNSKHILTGILLACLLIVSVQIVRAVVPGYSWTKVWGGADGVLVSHTATSPDGNNVYSAGSFYGTNVDFDTTGGTDLRSSAGNSDSYLVKYNSSGTFQWARTWGTSNQDSTSDIAVDSDGNIYVAGLITTPSVVVDMDATGGVDNYTTGTNGAIFIVKYLPDGSYSWTKFLPTVGNLTITSVVDGTDGYIYTFGSFQRFGAGTQDFDPGAGTDNKSSGGNFKFYIQKYSISGDYIWTQVGQGTGSAVSSAFGIDSNNSVYGLGSFQKTVDFDSSDASATSTSPILNINHWYIVKYTSSGNYVWHKTVSSPTTNGNLFPRSIAFDSSDYIYITGNYEDDIDFDPGEGTTTLTSTGASSYDFFLWKLSSGGIFNWVKSFGGTNYDQGSDIAVKDDLIYISGTFGDTVDFDPGPSTSSFTTTSDWVQDLFVAVYTNYGALHWVKRATGGQESDGNGLSFSSDSVYFGGLAYDTVDFDPDGGHDFIAGAADNGSATLTKLTIPAPPSPTPTPVPGSWCSSSSPPYAPNLFKAERLEDSVTIYFTPVDTNTTGYSVSYGYTPGVQLFNTSYNQEPSSGVLSYEFNELNPDRSYTFWVRAHNNCAAGPISNYLTIGTDGEVTIISPLISRPSETSAPEPSPTTISAPQDGFSQSTDGIRIELESVVITPERVVSVAAIGFGSILLGLSAFSISSTLLPVYSETARPITKYPFDLAKGMTQYMAYLAVSAKPKLFGAVPRSKPKDGQSFISINNNPLGGVFIIFYSLSGNLKSVVTNYDGTYEALVKPDEYQIRASKVGYKFPSEIVKQKTNSEHSHIYKPGEVLNVTHENEKIHHISFPLDPLKPNNG